MKKKEIKKAKTKQRRKTETAENQFGVILEDINSKFDLMSEGFSGVDKRFDDLNRKIDDNYRNLNKKVDGNQKETNSNFKTVFEYLPRIDDEIQSIKKELAEIKKGMINSEGMNSIKFLQIEKRVEAVEKELSIIALNR